MQPRDLVQKLSSFRRLGRWGFHSSAFHAFITCAFPLCWWFGSSVQWNMQTLNNYSRKESYQKKKTVPWIITNPSCGLNASEEEPYQFQYSWPVSLKISSLIITCVRRCFFPFLICVALKLVWFLFLFHRKVEQFVHNLWIQTNCTYCLALWDLCLSLL